MNKVLLIGRLGRDAETKHLNGGKAVLRFSIATDDGPKGPDGKPTAQWHACSSFNEYTLKVAQYLIKGKQVAVEGRLQYRKTEDGKTYTDIMVDRVELLGSKSDGQGDAAARQNANAFAPRKPAAPQAPAPGGEDDWGADEDQIPF